MKTKLMLIALTMVIQYPTISYATCTEAFLEWNVDDYTYSQIETVRISYEGSSGSANLSTSLYASVGNSSFKAEFLHAIGTLVNLAADIPLTTRRSIEGDFAMNTSLINH